MNFPSFKRIIAIGHSYGANALVNYMGTYKENCLVDAGISASNPFCFVIGGTYLKGSLYEYIMVKVMVDNIK